MLYAEEKSQQLFLPLSSIILCNYNKMVRFCGTVEVMFFFVALFYQSSLCRFLSFLSNTHSFFSAVFPLLTCLCGNASLHRLCFWDISLHHTTSFLSSFRHLTYYNCFTLFSLIIFLACIVYKSKQ